MCTVDALVCVLIWLTHILQCYFTGIGIIIRVLMTQTWRTRKWMDKQTICIHWKQYNDHKRRSLSAYISWWRHQMETFFALLAICAENSPAPVNYPHKGQRRGALLFSLICAWVWVNGWVNNREAGDLRRHRAHYDAIVMFYGIHCVYWHQSMITPREQNICYLLRFRTRQ